LKDSLRKGALSEASRFEALYTGKDGQDTFFDFTVTPMFNDKGAVVSLVTEA
jgi:hypothetical protein